MRIGTAFWAPASLPVPTRALQGRHPCHSALDEDSKSEQGQTVPWGAPACGMEAGVTAQGADLDFSSPHPSSAGLSVWAPWGCAFPPGQAAGPSVPTAPRAPQPPLTGAEPFLLTHGPQHHTGQVPSLEGPGHGPRLSPPAGQTKDQLPGGSFRYWGLAGRHGLPPQAWAPRPVGLHAARSGLPHRHPAVLPGSQVKSCPCPFARDVPRDELPAASGHCSRPAPLSLGVSWDGCNKSPQTGCLKTTGICSLGEQLWGPKGGNQHHQAEAGCHQGRGTPGAQGEGACSLLPPGAELLWLRTAPSDPSVCTQVASSSSARKTPPFCLLPLRRGGRV